jgi:hypothetical protein
MLTLIEFKLELMDLERVHHNIPSMKCLSLCEVIIFDGQVPQDVIPLRLMAKLKLDLIDVGDLDTHIQLYKYLGKKYPSVSKPIIDDNISSSNGRGYARNVYNKGILPFYQSLGSKIDTFFFIHYCDGLDAFRKFDVSGIKLKQLKLQCMSRNNPLFIEELVHSQQSKYIQKLVFEICCS